MSKRNNQRGRSYTRRKPTRVPKKSVLIVCEGEKTEPYYFSAMIRDYRLINNIDIVVTNAGPAAITIVENAIERREERCLEAKRSERVTEFDEIWCVLDVEFGVQASLARALVLAEANEINLALSNPYFEYWFLLHFANIAPAFSNKGACLQLLKNKKNWFGYKKNDPGHYNYLKKNTEKAIKRATQFEKNNGWGVDLSAKMPSTRVHHVVRLLQNLRDYK